MAGPVGLPRGEELAAYVGGCFVLRREHEVWQERLNTASAGNPQGLNSGRMYLSGSSSHPPEATALRAPTTKECR